jgi:hypothetical protein
MTMSAPPRPAASAPPREPQPSPLEALIEEARRRQRRRRFSIAAIVIAIAAGAAVYFGVIRDNGGTTTSSPTAPRRLCVQNVSGWRSRAVSSPGTPPALLLTNFRFGRSGYLYGHDDPQLRWPHGGILISIADWTSGATKAMLPQYRPTSALQIAASDFASFEGVRDLGQQHVRVNGQLLEVWVQARPTNASTIAAANRELANVRVCG